MRFKRSSLIDKCILDNFSDRRMQRDLGISDIGSRYYSLNWICILTFLRDKVRADGIQHFYGTLPIFFTREFEIRKEYVKEHTWPFNTTQVSPGPYFSVQQGVFLLTQCPECARNRRMCGSQFSASWVITFGLTTFIQSWELSTLFLRTKSTM